MVPDNHSKHRQNPKIKKGNTVKNETTGMCWHCNHPYLDALKQCPRCGSINPNRDLMGAIRQQDAMIAAQSKALSERRP